jgi:hypothetical protein
MKVNFTKARGVGSTIIAALACLAIASCGANQSELRGQSAESSPAQRVDDDALAALIGDLEKCNALDGDALKLCVEQVVTAPGNATEKDESSTLKFLQETRIEVIACSKLVKAEDSRNCLISLGKKITDSIAPQPALSEEEIQRMKEDQLQPGGPAGTYDSGVKVDPAPAGLSSEELKKLKIEDEQRNWKDVPAASLTPEELEKIKNEHRYRSAIEVGTVPGDKEMPIALPCSEPFFVPILDEVKAELAGLLLITKSEASAEFVQMVMSIIDRYISILTTVRDDKGTCGCESVSRGEFDPATGKGLAPGADTGVAMDRSGEKSVKLFDKGTASGKPDSSATGTKPGVKDPGSAGTKKMLAVILLKKSLKDGSDLKIAVASAIALCK